jgi:hypothetical protein
MVNLFSGLLGRVITQTTEEFNLTVLYTCVKPATWGSTHMTTSKGIQTRYPRVPEAQERTVITVTGNI